MKEMKEKVHHNKKRNKGLKSGDKVIVSIWFDPRSLFSVTFPSSTHSTHISLEKSRRDEYYDTPHISSFDQKLGHKKFLNISLVIKQYQKS
jgi:hypothetical protein